MPFKVTLLFQDATGLGAGGPAGQQHLGGWSESYYAFTSDINLLRTKLYGPTPGGVGLCPARAKLLPKSGLIVGQRIAQVFPSTGRTQTSGQSFPGSSIRDTDVPQMALMCTVGSATSVNIRRFSLRGVPDDQVTFGEFNPTLAYKTAVTDFFKELVGWAFVGQDFDQPNFDILNIDATGVVTLTDVNVFSVGELVQVQKTTNPILNKKFTLRSVVKALTANPNQFTLNTWLNFATVGGTVRRLVYQLYAMDGIGATADRVAVRKVGRPFGQYRGRRSKRATI